MQLLVAAHRTPVCSDRPQNCAAEQVEFASSTKNDTMGQLDGTAGMNTMPSETTMMLSSEEESISTVSCASLNTSRSLGWIRPTLRAGWRSFLTATEAVSLARDIVYISIKRATSKTASALWGKAAGDVADKGIDTISTARNALLPLSGMGCMMLLPSWIAVGRQQPHLVASAVHIGDYGTRPSRMEQSGNQLQTQAEQDSECGAFGEPWLLLGRACKQGFLELWTSPSTDEFCALSNVMERQERPSSDPSGWAGWQRKWCVLQDQALSWYDYQSPNQSDHATPLESIPWTEVVTISMRDHVRFDLHCTAGRIISLRADTTVRRNDWVSQILLLMSIRPIRALRLATESEWVFVRMGISR